MITNQLRYYFYLIMLILNSYFRWQSLIYHRLFNWRPFIGLLRHLQRRRNTGVGVPQVYQSQVHEQYSGSVPIHQEKSLCTLTKVMVTPTTTTARANSPDLINYRNTHSMRNVISSITLSHQGPAKKAEGARPVEQGITNFAILSVN